MRDSRAMIDGQAVDVLPDETILAAAKRVGVEIPTLCHQDGLPPEGGCRLCLVRTQSDGQLHASCHTRLEAGMDIQTSAPDIEELRRDILSLTLSCHEADCFSGRSKDREIGQLIEQYGLKESPFGHAPSDSRADMSHPYVHFDASLCVVCRRCVHACEYVQGQFVFGIKGRGAATALIHGPGDKFIDSDCTSCGACVDACPTGALFDVYSEKGSPESVTQSTCGYCGVGCQIEASTNETEILSVRGVEDAQVNHGHLCAKGRYAHAYHHSGDRLTQPLLRDGDDFRPVSWDEAIGYIAEKLQAIRRDRGPGALAAITSSRSTNEAGYLLQKLFRTALSTNNVDCCARVCHSSTALGLKTVTGTGAASASYQDIDRATCIVIAGANPTEAHPVVGARIKQAVLRGIPLVVIDPRRIELAEYADVHLQLRPGTNVPLFNAISKVIVESNLHNREYIAQRLEGTEEFERFVEGISLDEAEQVTGVPASAIEEAARLIAENAPALFVHGLGLSELTQGTASVMTLCNVGMITGSIGRPGAGMLPLRGQNNVQGNADMGGTPRFFTGYQDIGDEAVRAHMEKVWGHPVAEGPGLTIPEMFEAGAAGELAGLWIQGEDVAQSESNLDRTIKALQNLEFLVVQDLFMCETAKYAHVVLPAAGTLENDGTYTNGERRIQRVRPLTSPPGDARLDWEVIVDIANALGCDWSYANSAAVMGEIGQAAPKLFGGVSLDQLGGDGLQWPCPEPGHPGTSTVHADGFLRGKGQLVSIDYIPSPEQRSERFPFVLITGRVLQHYNVGTMTRRTSNVALAPADYLEVHPDDAGPVALATGDVAVVESAWGKTQVPVRITERVAPGTLFLSFHFPESEANHLTSPHVDPDSKCPEYKVTAVRIARASG